MVESFRGVRKLSSVAIETGICSRQDAKHAKFGSLILCAFARDIPSFGCGAQPRWVSVVHEQYPRKRVVWSSGVRAGSRNNSFRNGPILDSNPRPGSAS
jgi:hypothetical protein